MTARDPDLERIRAVVTGVDELKKEQAREARKAARARRKADALAALETRTDKDTYEAAKETASDICSRFDKRSPFAFLSPPDKEEQTFVGLAKGKLEVGRLCGTSKAVRRQLIAELRCRHGRQVSDIGYGNSMSDGMRAAYEGDPLAQKIWFDIPYPLKRAFLAGSAEAAIEPDHDFIVKG